MASALLTSSIAVATFVIGLVGGGVFSRLTQDRPAGRTLNRIDLTVPAPAPHQQSAAERLLSRLSDFSPGGSNQAFDSRGFLDDFAALYCSDPEQCIEGLRSLPNSTFESFLRLVLQQDVSGGGKLVIAARLCAAGLISPQLPGDLLEQVFYAASCQCPVIFSEWVHQLPYEPWGPLFLRHRMALSQFRNADREKYCSAMVRFAAADQAGIHVFQLDSDVVAHAGVDDIRVLADNFNSMGQSLKKAPVLRAVADRIIRELHPEAAVRYYTELEPGPWRMTVETQLAKQCTTAVRGLGVNLSPSGERVALISEISNGTRGAESGIKELITLADTHADDVEFSPSSMADLIYTNSADPAAFLMSNEPWHPFQAAVFDRWIRADVVSASRFLSELTDPPDTAIAMLVREIHDDPSSQHLWAERIRDTSLRQLVIESIKAQ